MKYLSLVRSFGIYLSNSSISNHHQFNVLHCELLLLRITVVINNNRILIKRYPQKSRTCRRMGDFVQLTAIFGLAELLSKSSNIVSSQNWRTAKDKTMRVSAPDGNGVALNLKFKEPVHFWSSKPIYSWCVIYDRGSHLLSQCGSLYSGIASLLPKIFFGVR
jgi:hypothetical protein